MVTIYQVNACHRHSNLQFISLGFEPVGFWRQLKQFCDATLHVFSRFTALSWLALCCLSLVRNIPVTFGGGGILLILSHVRGSVTNNNEFWIWWLDLLALLLQSLVIKSSITAHNQWLPKTRSIPYWTTSVFSSTVTDLVLIYESLSNALIFTNVSVAAHMRFSEALSSNGLLRLSGIMSQQCHM
jgi:hypothetical protein